MSESNTRIENGLRITKVERTPCIEVWLEAPATITYGEGGVTLYSRPVCALHYEDHIAGIGGWDHDGETHFHTQYAPVAYVEDYERQLRAEGWIDITETIMNDCGYTFTASLPPANR